MAHLYIGMENINLNDTQRGTLMAALQALGPNSARQPAWLNHWRVRLDNDAIILEADFNTDNLSVAAFKQRLADIFSVPVGNISNSSNQQSFGGGITTILTFTYNAIDYIRVALFGTINATWIESRQEVLGYLALYHDQWEPVE